MRICYLNHDLKEDTGAGRFGRALIGRLTALHPDFSVSVLTVEGSGYPWENPIVSKSVFRTLFSFMRIRNILRACDIVHALDGFPYGVLAALALVGLDTRLVITAIGTGAVQAFRHPIKGALLRWAYRRADKLVAVSNYTKREILAKVPSLHIDVINHAVDFEEFSGSTEEELTENERLEIEKLKPYILSVGGGKRRKGYEYSFPAFVEIEKRFVGLHYVVVGHDIEHTPADSLGIANKVFCFAWVRQSFLRALYRNAELFMLLPYNDQGDVEGFGFVFLEAAASGLPVVGTCNSGAGDAVDNGKNGFLVEPRNSDAAAGAALKILSDPALKERFTKGSVDFARRMNWGKVEKEYAEIYKRLTTNDLLLKKRLRK